MYYSIIIMIGDCTSIGLLPGWQQPCCQHAVLQCLALNLPGVLQMTWHALATLPFSQ